MTHPTADWKGVSMSILRASDIHVHNAHLRHKIDTQLIVFDALWTWTDLNTPSYITLH